MVLIWVMLITNGPVTGLMTQDFTGSSTSKAVPWGLMSITSTRPWWAVAICLTLARPKPVPMVLVVKKGSKI